MLGLNLVLRILKKRRSLERVGEGYNLSTCYRLLCGTGKRKREGSVQ